MRGTLLGLFLLVACDADTTGTMAPPDSTPDPTMPVTFNLTGPGEVDSLDGSGTPTCGTTLTLAGTFKSAGNIDPLQGCQPDGTWTVQVTVGTTGAGDLTACSPTPSVASSYIFTVAGSGRMETITEMNPMAGENDNFAINGDGGQCTGTFSMVNGSTQIVLHPATPPFGSGS